MLRQIVINSDGHFMYAGTHERARDLISLWKEPVLISYNQKNHPDGSPAVHEAVEALGLQNRASSYLLLEPQPEQQKTYPNQTWKDLKLFASL